MKTNRLTKIQSIVRVSLFSAAAFLVTSMSQAAVVTTVQDAFSDPAWSLLWNSGGTLGNPANYTEQFLTANPIQPGVNPFYAAIVGDPTWLFTFNSIDAGYEGIIGGHPGPGYSPIFKYTIQTTGAFVIQNSLVSSIYASNDGMDVYVFVNNNSTPLAFSSLSAGVAGATATFDVDLGNLSAGDAVYFAVSPRANNIADQYAVQFEIASIPEPGSIALLLGAGLLFVLVQARKAARA